MAGTQRERLNLAKQTLVAESTLQRIELRMELDKIHAATARLEAAVGTAVRVGPWLLPILSLLGVWTGRKSRKPPPAPASRNILFSAVRLVPTLLGLWRRFGRKNGGNET
jgi:hypothetical protein